MMAYKIEYTPEESRRYPQTRPTSNIKLRKFLLLFLLISAIAWMRISGVPDFLIPGDTEVTRTAATNFMDHIQTGMSVGEAVTTFCRQIIDGAGF